MYMSCTLCLLPSSCSLSLPESSATAFASCCVRQTGAMAESRWRASLLLFLLASILLLQFVTVVTGICSFLSFPLSCLFCTPVETFFAGFFLEWGRHSPPPPPLPPYRLLLACLWLCVALREGGVILPFVLPLGHAEF